MSRLNAWAAERSPITALRRDEAPAGMLDLDQVEGGEDPERLPGLLAGHACVGGGAIESDHGVAAALAAGVETIVARHTLPVLLAALDANRESSSDPN